MNKKLVKSIIPLCIFILFIATSLQKANDRYNDTAVVEAMVNDEEKIMKKMIKLKINLKLTIAKLSGVFKIYIKVKMNGIMN